MRAVKTFAFLLMLWPLAGGCAHHHHHHPGEGRLNLDDLPLAVRDHFNRDHPSVEVKGIERDVRGAVVQYDIRYDDQGQIQDAVYDREGDEIKPDAKLP
jgi:hypothetical protein